MNFHPAANLFPLLGEADLTLLANDIAEHGQHDDIITLDGAILDGRNRYRACELRNIAPRFKEWDGKGGSPLNYVISKNLTRRHLNTAQRGMIAGRIANLENCQHVDVARKRAAKGIPVAAKTEIIITIPQAAKMLNVSEETVNHARQVLRHCAPQDVQAIDEGRMSISRAFESIKVRDVAPMKKPKLNGAGKNPARIDRMRQRNLVWKNVREALIALTSLPLPADVAPIVKAMDRANLVPQKLPTALAWLREFAHVCDGNGISATQYRQDRPASSKTEPIETSKGCSVGSPKRAA
jgi:hypothetical protein